MLSEYHGRPVAGGTYPALIWKAYMEKALRTSTSGRLVPAPSVPYPSPSASSSATGQLKRDNGNCSGATTVQLFTTVQLDVAPAKPLAAGDRLTV